MSSPKARRLDEDEKPKRTTNKRRAQGRSLAAREKQIANMALDLAEKQIKEGTATSQVITHFLKIATLREELYTKALQAMTQYTGSVPTFKEDDDY